MYLELVPSKAIKAHTNYLIQRQKFKIKEFVFLVVSCSSPMIANMMSTRGLHGR
jgi:hypothetical protein